MASSKNDVLDKTFKEFEGLFRSGSFTSIEAEKVIGVCNAMLSRRLNPNPHYQAYLNALMAFKGAMPDEQRFREWHLVIDSLLVPGAPSATIHRIHGLFSVVFFP
jgi:hypothetical protein